MSENKDDLDLSDLSSAIPPAGALSAPNKDLLDKLQSLTTAHSDPLEGLAPKIRKRVETLKEFQKQYDELEAKFFEERSALEAKYQKLYEPLFTKRYGVVSGTTEAESVTTESTEEASAEDKNSEEKGVPNFWLTAMKNNEVLAEEIQERDEDALKFLKDIRWSKINDPKGFKLEFLFDPNPYFKNSMLTKIYEMVDENEPILEKATGTEIEWYPGKCLTKKIMKKKPKKGSKNTKPITKVENCPSFFNFFYPPEIPDTDGAELDEDTVEQLENQMEEDYEIGSTIRDNIIPKAVLWFTGEAVQGNESEDDEDEYEDQNEEEDEDDDGDDD